MTSTMPAVWKSELGRQAAVDEGERLNEVGVEFLPETGERLGEQHAVDAVGEIAVFAADVFLAEGIEDDAGGTKQDLLEGGILALGHGFDLFRPDGISGGAELRRSIVAGEMGADDDGFHFLGGGCVAAAPGGVEGCVEG